MTTQTNRTFAQIHRDKARAALLRGTGLVNGWTLTAGVETPDAEAPDDTEPFTLTTDRLRMLQVINGPDGLQIRTYAKVSAASVLRNSEARARGEAPEPPRTKKETFGGALTQLQTRIPDEIPDTGCVCCGTISPAAAGLTLTSTGLCWACAGWHRTQAAKLADPECTHCGGTWGIPAPAAEKEPWRLDPRTVVSLEEDDGELEEWFAARGRALSAQVSGGGEHYMLLDTLEGPMSAPTVTHSFDGGWFVGHPDHPRRPLTAVPLPPARHELFDLLVELSD